MIQKTDSRMLSLMIEKMYRLIEIYQNHSRDEINNNYVLSDSVQFEFEKLYEDYTRLSVEFRISHKELPIDKLSGIRNRVAHDYASVTMEILLDTIEKDIPVFRQALKAILEENN